MNEVSDHFDSSLEMTFTHRDPDTSGDASDYLDGSDTIKDVLENIASSNNEENENELGFLNDINDPEINELLAQEVHGEETASFLADALGQMSFQNMIANENDGENSDESFQLPSNILNDNIDYKPNLESTRIQLNNSDSKSHLDDTPINNITPEKNLTKQLFEDKSFIDPSNNSFFHNSNNQSDILNESPIPHNTMLNNEFSSLNASKLPSGSNSPDKSLFGSSNDLITSKNPFERLSISSKTSIQDNFKESNDHIEVENEETDDVIFPKTEENVDDILSPSSSVSTNPFEGQNYEHYKSLNTSKEELRTGNELNNLGSSSAFNSQFSLDQNSNHIFPNIENRPSTIETNPFRKSIGSDSDTDLKLVDSSYIHEKTEIKNKYSDNPNNQLPPKASLISKSFLNIDQSRSIGDLSSIRSGMSMGSLTDLQKRSTESLYSEFSEEHRILTNLYNMGPQDLAQLVHSYDRSIMKYTDIRKQLKAMVLAIKRKDETFARLIEEIRHLKFERKLLTQLNKESTPRTSNVYRNTSDQYINDRGRRRDDSFDSSNTFNQRNQIPSKRLFDDANVSMDSTTAANLLSTSMWSDNTDTSPNKLYNKSPSKRLNDRNSSVSSSTKGDIFEEILGNPNNFVTSPTESMATLNVMRAGSEMDYAVTTTSKKGLFDDDMDDLLSEGEGEDDLEKTVQREVYSELVKEIVSDLRNYNPATNSNHMRPEIYEQIDYFKSIVLANFKNNVNDIDFTSKLTKTALDIVIKQKHLVAETNILTQYSASLISGPLQSYPWWIANVNRDRKFLLQECEKLRSQRRKWSYDRMVTFNQRKEIEYDSNSGNYNNNNNKGYDDHFNRSNRRSSLRYEVGNRNYNGNDEIFEHDNEYDEYGFKSNGNVGDFTFEEMNSITQSEVDGRSRSVSEIPNLGIDGISIYSDSQYQDDYYQPRNYNNNNYRQSYQQQNLRNKSISSSKRSVSHNHRQYNSRDYNNLNQLHINNNNNFSQSLQHQQQNHHLNQQHQQFNYDNVFLPSDIISNEFNEFDSNKNIHKPNIEHKLISSSRSRGRSKSPHSNSNSSSPTKNIISPITDGDESDFFSAEEDI